MSTASVIGWTAAAVVGLVGGIALASSSKKTAAKEGKGGVVFSPWKKATVVNPGDHVRLSISQQTLDVIARPFNTTADAAGWHRILMAPEVVSVLQPVGGTSAMQAWAPGDKLPSDWPGDDTKASTEWHAEFVYGGTVAVQTNLMPIAADVWTIAPVSPIVRRVQIQPSNTPGTLFAKLVDASHMSTVVSRGIAITTLPSTAGATGALALYIWPQPPQIGGGAYNGVAVHIDFDSTTVTQQAMAFLSVQPPQGAQLGQPSLVVDIGAPQGIVSSVLGSELLVVPVGMQGSQTPLAWLAMWRVSTTSNPPTTFLQALTAPTAALAQSLATSSIAAWKAANPG